jgi:hypothetical protein
MEVEVRRAVVLVGVILHSEPWEQALNHDLGDFLGIAHVDSHYTAMGRCQVFEFTIW